MKQNRLAIVPVVVVALSAAAVTPASATPIRAKPLPCSASVSNAHPADYTTVYVRARTADRAHVVTVAHYRTTSHRKTGRANASGRATIAYYISGATPGYKVKVSVSVSRNGRKGSCSTSFTPHR
jgi:hypothetical protein